MSSSSLARGMVGVLLLATFAGAQATHKDTKLGFSFKPPKDYKAIAVSPGDVLTVAKYQAEQMEYGGKQGAAGFSRLFEVEFWSLPRIQEDDEEQGANATGSEGAGPRSVEEWWADLLDNRYGYPELEKDRVITVDGVDAREVEFPIKDSALKHYVAMVPQPDGVFLLSGVSVDSRFEKASQDFSKAARSFKRIERVDDRAHKSELSQMDEQERFLQQQIDKLPPGWSHLRTKRYLFLYDTDKAFAQELADRIEAMRDVYETYYPPDKPIEAVSIVRVCATLDEYHGYGGPQGTGGYWNSAERELVIFDFRPRELTLAVLNHEAFHQFIFYFYGELSPHSWYNEGTGDYYAGAKLTKSNRVTSFGDAPGGIGRLGTIKEAARLLGEGKSGADGACPPLKKLMKFHQRDYYGSSGYDGGICYAAGWGVVHFLREGKSLDPKWQKILPDYLKSLLEARHEVAVETMKKDRENAEKVKAGSSADMSDDPTDWYVKVDEDKVQDRAHEKTFKDWTDADWAAFQAAWLKYVEKL